MNTEYKFWTVWHSVLGVGSTKHYEKKYAMEQADHISRTQMVPVYVVEAVGCFRPVEKTEFIKIDEHTPKAGPSDGPPHPSAPPMHRPVG